MLIESKYVSKNLIINILRVVIKTALTVAAISLQIGLYLVFVLISDNLWYVRLGMSILAICVVVWIEQRNINSSYKIAWSFVILLAPVAGTALYLLFGGKRSIPRRRQKEVDAFKARNIPINGVMESLKTTDPKAYKLASTVYAGSLMPVLQNTKGHYFEDIFVKHHTMLEDLRAAKEYIFIEIFIASDGYVLSSILDILEEKGREGVQIKFIYDDIGSKKHLRASTKHRIVSIPNTQLCVYEPVGIRLNPRVNYRDHRKITVIDGKIGYIGGDNLADEYINKKIKFGHWRDNAMRIEGDAVDSLILLFCEMWLITAGIELDPKAYTRPHEVQGDGYFMPFGDGPSDEGDPAYDLFTALTVNADRYMYLSTPYFILDDAFIGAIELAAKSGVDVRILVPHVPDKKMVFVMTRGHYGKILRAGGRIFEYSPGFNHAKNVIVDDRYAFIGTVNCDYRSMFLHYENGALIIDNSEIAKMRDDFLASLEVSEEITLEQWKKRSLFAKLGEVLMSIISPML